MVGLPFLNNFREKVSSLPVLDLHHPEIRVNGSGSCNVGVEVGLLLSTGGAYPDGFPVSTGRLGEKARRAAGEIQHLDQNRSGSGITLDRHDREAPTEFNPPDEGGHPDVRGEFQVSRR